MKKMGSNTGSTILFTSEKVRCVMAKKTPSNVYWLGDNLYINITNQCPNNCYFCFRKYKETLNGFNLKLTEEPTTNQIVMAIQNVISKRRWKEIVFCGFGEPLTRLDTVLEVTEQTKKQYANTIRVVTNGQGRLINEQRKVVTELKQAGVDKISVSLNAQNGLTYDLVCKPKLVNAFQEVLNFIE